MRPEPAAGRRGARGRGARPADRAERRRPGDVHDPRELGARGADQAVHAAAARRRERLGPVRRADGRLGGRPRRAPRRRRGRTAPRARDRRRCPAGSSRGSSRPPTSSTPARASWSGPTATRRTPSGSRAPASTSRALLRRAGLMGVVVGLLLGAGVACVWWSFWARPAGPPRRARPAGTPGPRTCSCRRASPAVTPGGLVAASVDARPGRAAPGAGADADPVRSRCASRCSRRWRPWALVRGRARRRRARLRQLWPEVVDHLGVRDPGRALAAGGASPRSASADRSSCGAAFTRVRRGLPRDRPVRRVPRPRSRPGSPTRSRTGSSRRCG